MATRRRVNRLTVEQAEDHIKEAFDVWRSRNARLLVEVVGAGQVTAPTPRLSNGPAQKGATVAARSS